VGRSGNKEREEKEEGKKTGNGGEEEKKKLHTYRNFHSRRLCSQPYAATAHTSDFSDSSAHDLI